MESGDIEQGIPLRRARFTVQQALAYHNLQRSFKGEAPWSINELARRTKVSPTTIHRLFRDPDTDPKAASALSLDLATRICSVLECDISDLITVEVTDQLLDSIDKS